MASWDQWGISLPCWMIAERGFMGIGAFTTLERPWVQQATTHKNPISPAKIGTDGEPCTTDFAYQQPGDVTNQNEKMLSRLCSQFLGLQLGVVNLHGIETEAEISPTTPT